MPPLGLRLLRAKRENRGNKTAIEINLGMIRGKVTNLHQVDVFGKTVKLVVKTPSKSDESNDGEMRQVESILEMVKLRILENQESHQKCCEVLKDGSGRLRILLEKKQSAEEIKSLFEEEERAILLDQQNGNLLESNPSEEYDSQIYFMDKSKDHPSHRFRCDFSTYGEVVWYLHTEGLVEAPELWIRREGDGVQKITRSGYWWKFAHGAELVNVTIIYTISMKERSDYIVALVHEAEREYPMALDVPIFGKRSCCDPACASL
ncbi:hypothetical protein FRC17_000254, partial [Serendipita sp. 399]